MKLANPIVEKLQKRVVLLHGFFGKNFFDHFKKDAVEVFVLEGRPDLTSCQHTCRKLLHHGITPTVIADNMAGFLFGHGCVKEVWVSGHGKVNDQLKTLVGGTILQILAKEHNVPFYIFEGEKPLAVNVDKSILLKFNNIQIAQSKTKTFVPNYDLINC
ncbi:MAG: hypothetical protein HQL25_03030 [Candidatus Omnitrophica bacterium]|nr:hypothetical protein [Candidatus Omnitrophota bacterium]